LGLVRLDFMNIFLMNLKTMEQPMSFQECMRRRDLRLKAISTELDALTHDDMKELLTRLRADIEKSDGKRNAEHRACWEK
jgi:hypothetical protein